MGTLSGNNGEDWSGRALRFWREIETKKIQLPEYDYVYVDEAQFIAPVWLRALKAALKPTRRLLLAAEPTQGFLKRRQSGLLVAWISGDVLRGCENVIATRGQFWGLQLTSIDPVWAMKTRLS